MDILQAQKVVRRERSRWFSFATRMADDELMRRRERLLNGLTVFLALATLVGWFVFLGVFGDFGGFCILFACIVLGRQCSEEADECRAVRELLKQSGVCNLGELLQNLSPDQSLGLAGGCAQ
jgi:hypothetical protein